MGIFVANIDDREIRKEDDTLKLQRDIDRLLSCASKCGMRFQPVQPNANDAADKYAH